ncbi:hypothetical protein KGQ71_02920 [Patescibacteria group bacterium]|nr:hypothetical protein [Patescibacteria group bacterium]
MKTPTQVKVDAVQEQPDAPAKVHPLLKSYTFVSDRHVDYNNLSAFEAISMASVLVLAVVTGAVFAVV